MNFISIMGQTTSHFYPIKRWFLFLDLGFVITLEEQIPWGGFLITGLQGTGTLKMRHIKSGKLIYKLDGIGTGATHVTMSYEHRQININIHYLKRVKKIPFQFG